MKLVCVLAFAALALLAESPAELEPLIKTSAEPGAVMFEMARQYALKGDHKQALAWMEKAAALNPEYTPEFDGAFEGVAPFRLLIERARKASPPVRQSEIAFRIGENDLVPEGLAFDSRSGRFYLSSIHKKKIVEISANGEVRDFIQAEQDGIGSVLGMKVDLSTNTLWACSLSDKEGAGVFHFDLATRRLIKKYVLPLDLMLNDLVVTSAGDVFVTATRARTLYWISAKRDKLEQWREGLTLRGANGIALSPDEKRLFVATFPDGITVVDLETGTARPLGRPPGVTLASIDGLYFHRNSLIAIQNGCIAHRVARIDLNAALDRAERVVTLERGNPLFDIPTTGAIAGDVLYYLANSQLDNYGAKGVIDRAKLQPIAILKVKLPN